jgi:hypothetical protein
MNTWIVVTWQFEGFHSWPDAPEDVAFLRNNHRHLFKARARIETVHADRELEFFQVKRVLESLGQPGQVSCEEMSRRFVMFLTNKYGPRKMEVEVWEDGENGGGASL